MLKFGLLALLLAGAVSATRWGPLAGHLDRETLATVLAGLRQSWWSPLALIGLHALLSPLGIPASPLIFAGGAIFGPLLGTLYNLAGSLLGAALTFALGRGLGRDLIEHLGGRRLRQVERLIHRRGFWTLVRIRMLPIPFPLVNYAAAVVGVRAPTFLITTVLGLVPSVFAFTWLAAALVAATEGQRSNVFIRFGLALGLFFLLSFIPPLLQGRARRRRHRRLLEIRKKR